MRNENTEHGFHKLFELLLRWVELGRQTINSLSKQLYIVVSGPNYEKPCKWNVEKKCAIFFIIHDKAETYSQ